MQKNAQKSIKKQETTSEKITINDEKIAQVGKKVEEKQKQLEDISK